MDWLDVLNAHLDKCAKSGLLGQFKLLTNNYARAEFILKNAKFLELDRYLSSLVGGANDGKSGKRSDEARANGNAFFSQRTQNKKAFAYYTRALMNAPVTVNGSLKENKALVLAYSNRSAVFYEEKLFEECLADIDQCVVYLSKDLVGNADQVEWLFNLALKLANRQRNCYFKMQRIEALKSFVACQLYQLLYSSMFCEEKYETRRKELMAELQEQLADLLAVQVEANSPPNVKDIGKVGYLAQDCFTVEFSKEKGRHCLASRDIETGECLFVEEPYSAILLPEFAGDYCQTCFKSVYDPATELYGHFNIEFCHHCTTVVFCSAECRRTNQFHVFECRVLESLLHNVGVGHLAYRIVASTEPHLVERYAQIERTHGFRTDTMEIEYGKFSREHDYEQVFYLMTHEGETHVEDLFQYSLTAALLAKHLTQVSECHPSVSVASAASLILRHLLQTICNAHAITKLRDVATTANASTMDREQIRYATAIYPRVSLLNHSCNSNVLSSYREDSAVIVVKSGRPIRAQAEIFNCYGPHYLKMSFPDRKRQLSGQYHFHCECDKCVEQTQKSGANGEVNFCCGSVLKCLRCKKYPTDVQVTLEGLSQVRCSQCLRDTPLEEYSAQFEKYHSEMNSINLSDQTLIKENMCAIRTLLEEYQHLMFIDETGLRIEQENFIESEAVLIEPFKYWYMDFAKLVDAVSRLHCIMGNFPTAAEILQGNIKNLEFLYGVNGAADIRTAGDAVLMEHVEFAHEFQKLAEVQSNCGQFKQALISAEKAILIADKFYPEDNQVLRELCELRADIKNVLKVDLSESHIDLGFDNNLSSARLKFDKFTLVQKTFSNSKKNLQTADGFHESIFRFQILPESQQEAKQQDLDQSKVRTTELVQLTCSMCKASLLKAVDSLPDKKFPVLPLPDNEIDELADNFFCHLHSHDSGEHKCGGTKEAQLRESLNPLRETLPTLRKSALESKTIFVFNENHLRLDFLKVDEENLSISCRNCSYNLGYREKKRQNDYFIWKSNTQIDNSLAGLDLFMGLEKGRYLLETRSRPASYLYLFILSAEMRFKHYKYQMKEFREVSVDLNDVLSLKPLRKLMYKFEDRRVKNNNGTDPKNETPKELKELRNDFNVMSHHISDEHFEFLLSVLTESTEQLCQSLKQSNGFYFALV